MKKLTVKEINQALLELIEEQPEFIYNTDGGTCYYSRGPYSDPNHCNGCIFGQAFQRLGIDIKELKKIDRSVNSTIGFVSTIFVDEEIPKYWTTIQGEQDIGVAWGELKQFIPNNE